MHFSTLTLAAASLLLGSEVIAYHPPAVNHKHVALVKRAGTADNSTAYLPAIIAAATTSCQAGCEDISKIVAQCVATGQGDEETAGRCACGKTTLGVIRNCASCIVSDKASTGGQVPLMQYNAFVNQCISLGFTNATALAPIAGQAVSVASQITTITSSGSKSSMTSAKGASKSASKSSVSSSSSSSSAAVATANQSAASPTTTAPTAGQTSGANTLLGGGALGATLFAVVALLC